MHKRNKLQIFFFKFKHIVFFFVFFLHISPRSILKKELILILDPAEQTHTTHSILSG